MSKNVEIVSVNTSRDESGGRVEAAVVWSDGRVTSGVSKTRDDPGSLYLTETRATEAEAIKEAIGKRK